MVWLLAWSAAGGLGYLLGSLPTAYGVGIALADIRLGGDGNAGAANVGRLLGPRWGFFVGTVDIAKGFVPVLAVNALVSSWDTVTGAGLVGGVAAMAGHIWPVWLRFRGGRGAATALGVTAAVLTAPSPIGRSTRPGDTLAHAQHDADPGVRLHLVDHPRADILRRLLGHHLLLRGDLHHRWSGPLLEPEVSGAAGGIGFSLDSRERRRACRASHHRQKGGAGDDHHDRQELGGQGRCSQRFLQQSEPPPAEQRPGEEHEHRRRVASMADASETGPNANDQTNRRIASCGSKPSPTRNVVNAGHERRPEYSFLQLDGRPNTANTGTIPVPAARKLPMASGR